MYLLSFDQTENRRKDRKEQRARNAACCVRKKLWRSISGEVYVGGKDRE